MTSLTMDGDTETGGADGLARGRLIVDEPQAGYYLARSPYVPKARLHKDQIWVPARIWWSVPEDPDDFGELDTPPMKPYCEVDGRAVDAYAAWPYLAVNPTTKEEYEALKQHLDQRRQTPSESIFDEPKEQVMNINNAFPSNYLKASELQGRDVTVTMSNVVFETIGQDRKPVLYFAGTKKGMVLNKTNSNNISQLYGQETENWVGKKITLFPCMVDYQGKSVEAVRIRGASPTNGNGNGHHAQPTMGGQPAYVGAGNAGPLPQATAPLNDDLSDIPF